jgi:hypothetical protein
MDCGALFVCNTLEGDYVKASVVRKSHTCSCSYSLRDDQLAIGDMCVRCRIPFVVLMGQEEGLAHLNNHLEQVRERLRIITSW